MLKELLDSVVALAHDADQPRILTVDGEPSHRYGVYIPKKGEIEWRETEPPPIIFSVDRLDSFVELAQLRPMLDRPVFADPDGLRIYGERRVLCKMELSCTAEEFAIQDLDRPSPHRDFVRKLTSLRRLAKEDSELKKFTAIRIKKDDCGTYRETVNTGQSVSRSLVREIEGEYATALPQGLLFSFPFYRQLIDYPELNHVSLWLDLYVDAENGTLSLCGDRGTWEAAVDSVLKNTVEHLKAALPGRQILYGRANIGT